MVEIRVRRRTALASCPSTTFVRGQVVGLRIVGKGRPERFLQSNRTVGVSTPVLDSIGQYNRDTLSHVLCVMIKQTLVSKRCPKSLQKEVSLRTRQGEIWLSAYSLFRYCKSTGTYPVCTSFATVGDPLVGR